MMKRKRIAAVAVIASLFATPAVYAETLVETLVSAYKNSGLLEQNRALLRAADEGVAQSVAATLPVISWSLGADRTWSNATPTRSFAATNAVTLRIIGGLTLYDGGANKFAIESQKEIVLSTRQTLRGIEQTVAKRGASLCRRAAGPRVCSIGTEQCARVDAGIAGSTGSF
jgi:outer membrane protein